MSEAHYNTTMNAISVVLSASFAAVCAAGAIAIIVHIYQCMRGKK